MIRFNSYKLNKFYGIIEYRADFELIVHVSES